MNNSFDLTNRVALVTGGSKGLGKVMARAFAQSGADVIITSRREDELEEALIDILEGTNVQGHFIVADLTKRAETETLAREALRIHDHVDILVNNAGANWPQPIDKLTDENWDRNLELNLTAGMVLTRALAPRMKERRWGRVIYISSIMGLASKEERNSYSTTKTAVIGLARANALDLGPYNITVNCIAPGPFLTDLTRNLLTEEQKKTAAAATALRRWGEPEELAGPALLLASELGRYITGSVLVVDGGLLSKTW